MSRNRRDFTYDADLLLKDDGAAITADAAWLVAGAAKILDLGLARFDGRLIIDITAVEIDSNNERYDLHLQFSNSATFASGVLSGPCLPTGALETLIGCDTDTAVGRYELPFCNELSGTLYRYVRGYTNVTGTIVTGIDFSAFIARA